MAPRLFACFSKGGRRDTGGDVDRHVTADLTAEEQKRGGPVVVEMFSSQGCATSPAAELVLSRLGRGDFGLEVPVVVMTFHVDYWDYMGWKDPFGSSQWTVRQKAYVEALGLDTLLTPQIVVQGKKLTVLEMTRMPSFIASLLPLDSLLLRSRLLSRGLHQIHCKCL